MKAKIAAVILGKAPIRDAVYAKKNGADMLELRIDQFRSLKLDYLAATINEMKKKTRLPVIATLRYRGEENFLPVRHRISEDKRLAILSSILPLVDFVDIELRAGIAKAVISRAHAMGKKVIVSYHNFKKTPPDKILDAIAKKAKRAGADIVKITTFANTSKDVARLMVFTYLSKARPIITIAMGRAGAVSRLIAPIFGSCITYAAAAKKAAPGQFSITSLKNLGQSLFLGTVPIF